MADKYVWPNLFDAKKVNVAGLFQGTAAYAPISEYLNTMAFNELEALEFALDLHVQSIGAQKHVFVLNLLTYLGTRGHLVKLLKLISTPESYAIAVPPFGFDFTLEKTFGDRRGTEGVVARKVIIKSGGPVEYVVADELVIEDGGCVLQAFVYSSLTMGQAAQTIELNVAHATVFETKSNQQRLIRHGGAHWHELARQKMAR